MNQATQEFILQHQDRDVRQLAFLGSKYPEVDMPFALDQIRGRQMARAKLPRWASIDGIIYPPHISMEQCSSEMTAQYKAELAARWLTSEICENPTKELSDSEFAENEEVSFVDLTGGFGVDFSYIAARLGVRAMYVERQAHLCETAKENFKRLGLTAAEVTHGDGEEVLHTLRNRSLRLIFIDPARRDYAGNKVVSLQDCTPDVTRLQDEMLQKADVVIIKLSPMLDWHSALSELKCVREVHIVSTGNECKELLLVLSAHAEDRSPTIYCVNDAQVVAYDVADKAVCVIEEEALSAGQYLYEPNVSLMKAGCFGIISARYGVRMLSKNSHLFVSNQPIADFPGRSFHILAVSSLNKKELKRQLGGITKANIAVRNFPLSVAELRKRLKLKEGGDAYIFATTFSDDAHVLVVCEKIVP